MPGVTLTYSVITRVNDIPYRVCLLLEGRGGKSIEGGRGVGAEKKWGLGGGGGGERLVPSVEAARQKQSWYAYRSIAWLETRSTVGVG